VGFLRKIAWVLRRITIFVKFLWRSFSLGEKGVLLFLGVVVLVGSSVLLGGSHSGYEKPTYGGVVIEGEVGAAGPINPLFARPGTPAGDIARLVFSGLTKQTAARQFVPDLSESWEILDKGKVYIFHIRKNAVWHDGEPVTADDVVFTINSIQNPAYGGYLSKAWNGIVVEALDSQTVRFTLPNRIAFFLATVAVGILPQHIYKEVPVEKMALADQPVIGSGPFKIIKSGPRETDLVANPRYYLGRPYLDRVVFRFFDSENALFTAFKNRQVTNAGFSGKLNEKNLNSLSGAKLFTYLLPQYRAVFFNQMSVNKPLKELAVRQALAYGVNKKDLIEKVLGGAASVVESPILKGFWGHKPDIKKYSYDPQRAREILRGAGWKDTDKDGYFEKGDVQLTFQLAFRDEPVSRALAEALAGSWKAVGAEAILKPYGAQELVQSIIRPRNYEALLFGQDLGVDSDPYVYWHSSQVADPGLALAVFFDKDIDNNLEAARTASNLGKAIEYYHYFQNAFVNTLPAILFSQPHFVYVIDDKIKGIDGHINFSSSTDRFANITQWYIKAFKADNSDESELK